MELGIREFRINSMMGCSGNAKVNSKELVPKLSEIAPVIEDILKIKCARITLGDFPPCIFSMPLKKALERLGEYSSDAATMNKSYEIDERGERKDLFSWKARRKNTLKTLAPKCRECGFMEKCEGVWKSYYELFGGDELNPIRQKN
jgi:hypothetical protein